MGLLPEQLNENVSVTIDLDNQRKLGMHLVEYAVRNNVSRAELREMLSMLGL